MDSKLATRYSTKDPFSFPPWHAYMQRRSIQGPWPRDGLNTTISTSFQTSYASKRRSMAHQMKDLYLLHAYLLDRRHGTYREYILCGTLVQLSAPQAQVLTRVRPDDRARQLGMKNLYVSSVPLCRRGIWCGIWKCPKKRKNGALQDELKNGCGRAWVVPYLCLAAHVSHSE